MYKTDNVQEYEQKNFLDAGRRNYYICDFACLKTKVHRNYFSGALVRLLPVVHYWRGDGCRC
jgi:hypothetical protein